MKRKYIAAFLLIEICFIKISNGQLEAYRPERKILGGSFLQAATAIRTLPKTILNTIKKVVETLEDNIFMLITMIESAGRNTIQIIRSYVQSQIEKVESRVRKLGLPVLNISECMRISGKIDVLINDTAKFECVSHELETVFQIIKDGIDIFLDIEDMILGLPDKLSICKTVKNKAGCLASIILSTVKQGISLPVKITREVAKINLFISLLRQRLITCAIGRILKLVIDTALVVTEIIPCTISKM